jgi:dolichol-phosphate mannosyltransferase
MRLDFAIVIPMKDEVDAVSPLLDGCLEAGRELGTFEICVTDDGSRDGTSEALRAWAARHPDIPLSIVTHATSAGQSAAVHNAVRAARAPIIVTLDGDGQNPPDQIGKVLAPLLAADCPCDLALVAGQRVKRDDPPAKRIASRLANGLRSAVLRDNTRDTGCGLKAFRCDAFLALPFFNHMHRFLPALFKRDGWEVAHVDVTHKARESGRSKYNNLQRGLVGATDLIGVAWLIRRRKTITPKQITTTRGERDR